MPLLFAQLTAVPLLTRQMHLQVRAVFPMRSVLTGSFLCVLSSLGDSGGMQSVMVMSQEMCTANVCAAMCLAGSACAAYH